MASILGTYHWHSAGAKLVLLLIIIGENAKSAHDYVYFDTFDCWPRPLTVCLLPPSLPSSPSFSAQCPLQRPSNATESSRSTRSHTLWAEHEKARQLTKQREKVVFVLSKQTLQLTLHWLLQAAVSSVPSTTEQRRKMKHWVAEKEYKKVESQSSKVRYESSKQTKGSLGLIIVGTDWAASIESIVYRISTVQLDKLCFTISLYIEEGKRWGSRKLCHSLLDNLLLSSAERCESANTNREAQRSTGATSWSSQRDSERGKCQCRVQLSKERERERASANGHNV